MKHSKLVAFDVDGTLVELGDCRDIWKVLNLFFKVDVKIVEKMHREFMERKICYEEWATRAFAKYMERGANHETLDKATKSLKPMLGSLFALQELKRRKKKLAIISGSIDFVIKKFYPASLFDYLVINKVYFNEAGKVSKFEATSFGSDSYKADGLRDIAHKEGISLEDCVFVGDSDNDVEISKIAGSVIGFYPSPKLKSLIQKRKKSRPENFQVIGQSRHKDLAAILNHVH